MEQFLKNIYRIPVPLPGSPLKQLSCFLIKGETRNLMIDTGFNHPECEQAVRQGMEELGLSMENTDIFLTHLHADHSGLCARLQTPDTKVYISHIDGLRVNGFLQQSYWDTLMSYQNDMGFPEDKKLDYHLHPAYRNRIDRPVSFTEVKEGDFFNVGGYHLQAVDLAGHTPGQLGLWDEAASVLFGGDHILAKITPNINFWDFEADYLGIYLKNLRKVRQWHVKHLYSAHRALLDDADARIDELLIHHANRLEETRTLLRQGLDTVYQIAVKMHWDYGGGSFESFPPAQKWFAASEVFAHLEHLNACGETSREKRGGAYHYTLL